MATLNCSAKIILLARDIKLSYMKRTGVGLKIVILCTSILLFTSCELTQPTGTQYIKFEESFVEYAKLDSNYLNEKKTQKLWNDEIREEYHFYKYNDTIISQNGLDSLRVEVICGSWCHDTRQQVVRFSKILDSLNFPTDSINYHFVDRDKIPYDSGFAMEYQFRKVPVIVFYKNGKEIGSIIESPDSTLEVDMKSILKK